MAPIVQGVVSDRKHALSEQEAFLSWVAGDRERFEREVDVWLGRLLAHVE